MEQSIKTVDEYILGFPPETRIKLHGIRKIIKDNAPAAVERIAYAMPAYTMNKKPLVYFGGFAKHIGFYAMPSGHEKFKEKLSRYKHGKGSVQFPLNLPLPTVLIAEIVKFRILEVEHLIASEQR